MMAAPDGEHADAASLFPDRFVDLPVVSGRRGGLYAKISVAVAALAILFYVMDHPEGPPNGGSTLGYIYGTIGVGLIVWLAWFGIRRRRYGGEVAPLEFWLSAHVYLGLALIVIATLHTGFRFHWNVHTLAYVLMVLVILSGVFGIYTFVRYPALMTRNRAGATLSVMAAQLAAADAQCRDMSLAFDDRVVELVVKATDDDGGPPSLRETLLGWRPDLRKGSTWAALDSLQLSVSGSSHYTPSEVIPLVQGLTNRLVLVERMRRDRRYQALMVLWRAVHVPLTIALIVALAIHVFAVFFYW